MNEFIMVKPCWKFIVVVTVLTWITCSANEQPRKRSSSDSGDGKENTRESLITTRYLAPSKDCKLRAYDADKEAHVIKEWYDMVKDPIDEKTAVRQLLVESCGDDAKNLRIMCYAFIESKLEDKCIPGLTKAECIAVLMYTAEGGGFYREFNEASANGVWAPYRIYTTLLFSAVKKMSRIEPVTRTDVLYRGMRLICDPPKSSRIFWKTFTSTSLDSEVAEYFGKDTSLVFESPATIVGARIRNLSFIEGEEEVLIPPFEIYNFVSAEDQKFYFKVSDKQELLQGNTATHLPLPGKILAGLFVYYFLFLSCF